MKLPPETVIAYVNRHMTLQDGVFYWKQSPHRNSSVKPGDVVGTKTVDGVMRLNIFHQNIFRSHVIWIMTHGKYPDGRLERRDKNKLNDRIENLRLVRFNPKTKPVVKQELPAGITHQPRRGLWRVDVAGQHIGSYSSINDAMQAHRRAVMP